MDLLNVHPFRGADRVLAAHGPALPQPDQLCGPFSAWAALHVVVPAPPSVGELAVAAGTRIWPHDVAAWRPDGAPLLRTGWNTLPPAVRIEDAGTDAAGLAAGIATLCPDVAVVPASGADWSGLHALLDDDLQAGVLANVRTGPIAPAGVGWDVGHFVVLWGRTDGGRVAVADTYRELGAPGLPPGCRLVDVESLAQALVGRGLLLLTAAEHADDVRARVRVAGLSTDLWST